MNNEKAPCYYCMIQQHCKQSQYCDEYIKHKKKMLDKLNEKNKKRNNPPTRIY